MVKLLNTEIMAKPKLEASFPDELETLSFSFFYQVLKELVVFPQQTWKNIFKQSILLKKILFFKQNKTCRTITYTTLVCERGGGIYQQPLEQLWSKREVHQVI